MPSEPMARFAASGETLDPELRREVLALGAAAIPDLLRVLSDDSLQEGWLPIHAVELLVDLKATEAVEPMLRVLCESDWDHIIHDRLIVRMPELGAAVVEPALAIIEGETSEDVHHSVCSVLAKAGVRDPRIYEHLCAVFDDDEILGAMCLADYGDPAALPILEGALEDFEPEHYVPYAPAMLADLMESFEQLGGVLTPQLERHLAALETKFTVVKKPDRNDPCSCGSGKKYKRCCLK